MANEKRLIYANALESDIKKMYVPYGDGSYSGDKEAMIYDEAMVEVLEALDKAPTVDAVEVVHGRWLTTIDIDYEGDVVYHHAHMKCGFECETYGDGYNYCPNCGAKMDGGNEDG